MVGRLVLMYLNHLCLFETMRQISWSENKAHFYSCSISDFTFFYGTNQSYLTFKHVLQFLNDIRPYNNI